MQEGDEREQDNEERTIQLILESLNTLKQLSGLHQRKLIEISNDSTSTPESLREIVAAESRVADTITKLSDNSLRGFTSFLNRYYDYRLKFDSEIKITVD